MLLDRRFLSGIIVFLLVSSSILVVSSETNTDSLMTFEYTFSEPEVLLIDDNGDSFLEISYLDYPLTGSVSFPQIPFKPVTLILPKGTESYSVEIETGEDHIISLPKDIPIRQTSEMRSFSTENPFDLLGQTIALYPEKTVDVLDVQYKHGVGMLTLLVYPFQYDGEAHTLKWYETISIFIESTQKSEMEESFIHEEKISATNWIEIVDNPGYVMSYHDPLLLESKSDLEQYDYVLITSESLLNSTDEEYDFYDLLDARETFGLSTFLKTVEDIIIEYEGVDTQEKIRNFIKYMYQNHNATYVLLGGDTTHIPIRMLYGGDSGSKEDFVSSDLYYQCLDGNYNYNDNDKWGEFYDGVNGEIIDLHAEVYLGRAPARTPHDVSNFVEKTITYEQSDLLEDAYLQRVLSAGEFVWSGAGGWGAGYLELCIDHQDAYNQVTDGIPSHRYTVVEKYERDEEWSKFDIMAEINEGVNMINHVGHGSIISVMKLRVSDIHQLENEGKYGLFYSQACYSGQIQSANCIASHWVNAEKKGGFAAIMNSGEGFGSTINYDGYDNRFTREFFNALFSPSEQISRVGEAHMRAKEANYYRIHDRNMLYVYYNKLLLGCPFVEIKGSENTNAMFSFEPEYPRTGQLISFTDESTGWLTIWQWDFDDGHVSYQQHNSHAFDFEGVFNVRLMVRDSSGYQSTVIKEIEVRDNWPPEAVINPSSHQGKSLSVAFSAENSFDPDGTIVSYQWNFDDGVVSTEKNPIHTFSDFGSYRVRLLVTDNDGLMDTAFCNVVLRDDLPPSPPQQPIGIKTVNLGDEGVFQTQLLDSHNDFIQYRWEFGDDGISNWSVFYDSNEQVSVSHRWQTPGQQFVRVKARDQDGLESEWSEKLMVMVIDDIAPEILITRPDNAVYLRNTRLFSFSQAVLIGDSFISADVDDEDGVEKVVFYIDGVPVAEVNTDPYEWYWESFELRPKRILVQLQAFDHSGNQAWASVTVLRIF